ncbi:MAG: hypothetical protein ACREEE_02445 [Dongiaceae bacterium]
MEGHKWACPNCGRDLPDGRACSHCASGDDDTGFRFPIWRTVCIGAFVVGAILYQTNPEVGAVMIRLAGFGRYVPD